MNNEKNEIYAIKLIYRSEEMQRMRGVYGRMSERLY